MQKIISIVYNLIVKLFDILLNLTFQRAYGWENRIKLNILSEDKKILWIHGASSGEIELCIPIINRFSNDYNIIVSFFSISGINHFREATLFQSIFLLPLDTKHNASKTIKAINPDLVLWMNNELWLNFLTGIKQNNIPIFLINATFSKKGSYNFLLKIYQDMCLMNFTAIHSSIENTLLDTIGFKYHLQPHLKIERSFQNTVASFHNEVMETQYSKGRVLILGSVYKAEVALFLSQKNYKPCIPYQIWIFPHNLDRGNITKIREICLQNTDGHFPEVHIFDKPHLLRFAYRYADIIYIGGGFGKGIHNIFEALVYNKQIVTGNNYCYHQDAAPWLVDNNIIAKNTLEEAVNSCYRLVESNNLPIKNNFTGMNASNSIYNWICSYMN